MHVPLLFHRTYNICHQASLRARQQHGGGGGGGGRRTPWRPATRAEPTAGPKLSSRSGAQRCAKAVAMLDLGGVPRPRPLRSLTARAEAASMAELGGTGGAPAAAEARTLMRQRRARRWGHGWWPGRRPREKEGKKGRSDKERGGEKKGRPIG